MTLKQVFESFKKINCVSFATTNDQGYVDYWISRFSTYDHEGLYFWTNDGNTFYQQLVQTKKITAHGMYPKALETDTKQRLRLTPQYTITITGNVRELSSQQVRDKIKTQADFRVAAMETEDNPAARYFLLCASRGEMCDYGYKKMKRNYKLLRRPFSFGGMTAAEPGFMIASTCIECGLCLDSCPLQAIQAGSPFSIEGVCCDECGNCRSVCPVHAIGPRECIAENGLFHIETWEDQHR